MLKRLVTLFGAVAILATSGCSSGSCGCSPWLHCDPPCYCKSLKRDARQIMDVVDVSFLNYDRHDPFRCDPCIGD